MLFCHCAVTHTFSPHSRLSVSILRSSMTSLSGCRPTVTRKTTFTTWCAVSEETWWKRSRWWTTLHIQSKKSKMSNPKIRKSSSQNVIHHMLFCFSIKCLNANALEDLFFENIFQNILLRYVELDFCDI